MGRSSWTALNKFVHQPTREFMKKIFFRTCKLIYGRKVMIYRYKKKGCAKQGKKKNYLSLIAVLTNRV